MAVSWRPWTGRNKHFKCFIKYIFLHMLPESLMGSSWEARTPDMDKKEEVKIHGI